MRTFAKASVSLAPIGSVRKLASMLFGTEAGFNAMVIERLGPSLYDLFVQCHFRFSLKTVLLLAGRLVSNVFNAVTWSKFLCVSSVTCNISILATSFTVTSNPAILSWALASMQTWFTSSISDSRRSLGIPIHVRIFHTAMVVDLREQLPSLPLIVTWAWSWEGVMI